MDIQNLSAPSCSQPLNPRGITHIRTRHTTRFTVVGNHLAQHGVLSLTAIGLACHIQSLPSGARVDIKTLAARFPEGETRIAAALRELEAHGYLARIRERLPSGRMVTHTVSYNQPQPRPAQAAAPKTPRTPEPLKPPPPAPMDPPPPAPAAPEAAPGPPLPVPLAPDLARHRTATALLAGLHRHDPRLLLSERAVRRLAPAVAVWLERGAHPDAVRHALTANLPQDPLRHPAALLAHRLTELLPPPAPPVSAPPPSSVEAAPPPFHNCENCERAIRTPHPGAYCRDCRDTGLDTGAAA
ncbi:DNA-binding protein [Streptomyces sp. SAT1]|uniref:hypothetical protein n=1 Tax=Streptomyces sp. SAT1 TaxID=1849967 RepID=UPI0007DDD02D|nr:hypothetical protein [Streptomyces sp. SAT1]ANH92931.1 DNA-binding protein [Streptomyces sp. SAT1]